MAKQTILVGTTANDGTGDTLRSAGLKINNNFNEVYSNVSTLQSNVSTLGITAQAAFDKANTGNQSSTTDAFARTTANDATILAQIVFESSNTIGLNSQAAFDSANTIGLNSQAAFDKANTIGLNSQGAFDKANATGTLAQAAFDVANTVPSTSDGTYLNLASNTGVQLQYDPTSAFIDSSIANGSWLYVDSRGLAWESNTTGNYTSTIFGNDGSIVFPVEQTSARTGSGENLKFNKSNYQKIISTQNGTVGAPTVERIVISGGDGYYDGSTYPVGEAGDIYLWAGRGFNGGDIKVDAGQSYGSGIEGGTIKIRGGNANYTDGIGGHVEIRAGLGATNGSVYTYAGGNQWVFDGTGNTSIPNALVMSQGSTIQDIPDQGGPKGVFLTVNNNQFQFDTGGRLHIPNDLDITFGGITAPGTLNIVAGSQQFSFGSDGGLSIPQDLDVGGQSIFTGNVTFNGTVTLPGVINQVSGNSGSYFGYASNGVNALYAGIPTYTPLPDTVFQTSGYVNGYVQNNFENTHPGNQASAEWVVTADNGTDSTGYIDYGIAGSGWDGSQVNSLGDAVLANDGWVYVQNGTGTSGGNLILGTTTEGKKVKINAGGPGAANTVAYFDNTGLTVSANVTASQFIGNVAWSSVTSKPNFATVATSGSYNDLTDKPTIPSEYTLPTATGSVLGGIKIGSGLSIDGSGVVSVTGGGAVDAGTLTGSTLSSNVTSSSLTSVGTLTSLTTSGSITRSGNINSTAWTINGAGLKLPAATYTDTSSSGSIGTNVAHAIGVPTFASTNVTTISNAIGLYLAGDPVGGTNTTVTAANSYALYNAGKTYFVGTVRFNGALQSGGGATALSFSNSLITANMPITVTGAVTASGGFASGTSSYNFQSLPSAVNGNGFTGTGAVLIDIWKFSVPNSGNRSLQFTRGAGSVDANFIGSEMHFNSGSVTGSALSGTTSGSWQYFNNGHQFGNGDVAVYTFNDTTNNKTYRVTVVYTSATNSSITAERIA